MVDVATHAAANRAAGRRGCVTIRKETEAEPGTTTLVHNAISVFPCSYTPAKWRVDAEVLGVALPGLAPVRMGPIRYASWLPAAARLETLTACRLMYDDDLAAGAPDAATRVLDLMAVDRVIVEKPALNGICRGRQPVCARIYTTPATWHDVDIVRYRQFFCNYYAHAAEMSTDFAVVKQILEGGNDICITGPTARSVRVEADVLQAYNDATTAFGHELVLFGMLTGVQPWKAALEPALWEVPLDQSVPLFT
jgi:hypothetical protein